MLRSLLAPCDLRHFATAVRERGALLVRRPRCPDYNGGILCADDVWQLLKTQRLRYGTNVDVALYTADRLRETFNYNAAEPPLDVRSAPPHPRRILQLQPSQRVVVPPRCSSICYGQSSCRLSSCGTRLRKPSAVLQLPPCTRGPAPASLFCGDVRWRR